MVVAGSAPVDGAGGPSGPGSLPIVSLVERVRERLAAVRDPELDASIVELGMVRDVAVEGDGDLVVTVALTTMGCPLRSRIERDVRDAGFAVDGVRSVEVRVVAMDAEERGAALRTARARAQAQAPTTTLRPGVPAVAIASGKGGVGKSSVTANLAAALARRGRRVGVLDADVWGFSLSRLLGVRGPVEAVDGRMVPLERAVGAGSLHVLSMGLLAEEGAALLWRGLVVQKAVAQFLEDADWSGVDILLVDTPPGTGDIPMTLSRLLASLGVVVVTTPHPAAQGVAARTGDFARKSNLRLLGVVENMAPVVCEAGVRHAYFGEGGGALLAESLHTELLASIPLREDVAAAGDAGRPVASAPDADFDALVDRLVELAPPGGAAGCSARLLDAVARAVAEAPLG